MKPGCHSRTVVAMDTLVTATVVSDRPARSVTGVLERALRWLGVVESACSRFEPGSEVTRLASRPGAAVALSPIVFAALRIALTVAEASGGAFDPTVGAIMQSRGFDRNYRTGRRIRTPAASGSSWRDVNLDPAAGTVRLARPLLLDLGAVAKGLAVDLAIGELAGFPGATVEAGGDVRVRGVDERGERWRIGIRHPRGCPGIVVAPGDAAVCTSGGYARPVPSGGHHLLDPRTGQSPAGPLSATVVAPTCAAADALATAAFVLGPADGIELLERERVEGLIVAREGTRQTRRLAVWTDAA